MRSQWVCGLELGHVLAALTAPNRLVCEVCLATGLRIGDVLNLKTAQLRQKRFTIKEQKTGKSRLVYLPKDLHDRLLRWAGRVWVFEGRLSAKKHRTRQAVFKDLRRAAKAFRITAHVTPHSLRKVYAVEYFQRSGCNLEKVRKLLNHSTEAVTMIYAMADRLKLPKKGPYKLPKNRRT